jgi:plastocyanin|tara:strand:+ start:4820 stop:5152 length:333 start_codon:yes stop_codon:yes gene_type:complete
MKIQILCLLPLAMSLSCASVADEVIIDQLNKEFVFGGETVAALTIKTGDTLVFRNRDEFFHNIYSLSDLTTFDLGSFPKGDARSVTFDEPGVAEIECAIHPDMYMTVEVE